MRIASKCWYLDAMQELQTLGACGGGVVDHWSIITMSGGRFVGLLSNISSTWADALEEGSLWPQHTGVKHVTR